MAQDQKPYKSGKFLSLGRLSALCCLLLLTLTACGEATSTPTPPPPTAPASPTPGGATTAPTTGSATTGGATTGGATTGSATTGGATTPTLGNPLGGKTPGPTGGATTPGGTPLGSIPDEIKKSYTLISADLAKRSNLPPASFQITGYTTETFPDSALGCPDPSMMYTQVLTPGYTIQVAAGGQSYDYRSNLAGTHIVLCGANGQPVPTPKP
jgi:hypothetical protein